MHFHTLIQLSSILTCISYISKNVEGGTPLCDFCPCNSRPNNPPNINCNSARIGNIYDTSFWIDDFNASYPIASLSFKNNNLKTLQTKFPPSNLKLLDLSNNSIGEIRNSVFSHLQSVEELILGDNHIERLNPDVFRGVYKKGEYFPLRSLRTLDLRNNRLHTLDADVFEHTDELEKLILSNNPFKVVDAQTATAVASLVNLRVLDMSYTQIDSLPDYFMHTPKSLCVLDLSGNNFLSIPEALSKSHSLEVLYFNNNPVRSLFESSSFPRIPTLKALYMCEMPLLEEVGAAALGGLENLQELHLSLNKRLTRIHPDAMLRQEKGVKAWLSLTKLFMADNSLSYLDRHMLLRWNQLEELDVSGNLWSCDCENQWMVDELIPLYMNLNEYQAKELLCESPVEMQGLSFYELHQRRSSMRCLDIYGNRPEQDALLLIGLLSGKFKVMISSENYHYVIPMFRNHWDTRYSACDGYPQKRLANSGILTGLLLFTLLAYLCQMKIPREQRYSRV